jgi:chromate reductase
MQPIALQSASPGPLGGARVQYGLRRSMVFLDALTLNTPEIFIGNCAAAYRRETGQITGASTKDFIKQQLAAFRHVHHRAWCQSMKRMSEP